jgi:putative DNA primase/helicase
VVKYWRNEHEERPKSGPYGFALGMNLVQEAPIRWLWPGRIVMENLTLLVGDPNVGKSLVALDLAARVTRGAEWPDGAAGGEPKSVLLVTAEDHVFFTLKPALAAAGTDMDKIASVWDVRDEEGVGEYRRPLELPKDFEMLRSMIKDRSDCKLVVIDPITAFVRGGMNQRNTLMRLVQLAGDLQVAILGVAHLRAGGMRAMYRTAGGLALTSTARAVWMLAEAGEVGMRNAEVGSEEKKRAEGGSEMCDPKYGKRRLVLPVKNNLVREIAGLAYTLEKSEGRVVPRVAWEKGSIEDTADEVLGRLKKTRGAEATERKEAMEYLRSALAGGPRLVKEIEAEADELHAIKRRTLVRARKVLGVRPFRVEGVGPFWMALPGEAIGDRLKKGGTVGTGVE